MSTKASIFLTDCNLHWYTELGAEYNHGIKTPDNSAIVFEFGPECVIEDFCVAIPSGTVLARIINRARPELVRAEELERTGGGEDE